uniref:Collagen, type VI, alpha 3 n=1 Tax=Oryzias latipes TaxID=8090 RepID=A0A3P9LKQ2_ORYLA
MDAVRGLRHRGGRPLNTGAALQYVMDNVFTNSTGSRRLQGVPQILILLAGGRSFDNVDTPASALKQRGIFVFAIGSRTSDSRELQRLSFEPSYALSVSDFSGLDTDPGTNLLSDERVLSSKIDILSSFLSLVDTAKKDVVFLLDGSDGTRNGFSAMRDFVERLVEKLSVGENKDRVSVVQYSREAEVHFSLNTHRTREDVMDAVRGLRHRGGRPLNTGAALQYVMDNVFTNSTGSRRLQGVPQILILLAGGRSFDNVDTPASALKQRGIFVFAIGSRTSDSRELQRLSFEPSYALSVSDFSGLDTIQEQISSLMSAAVVRSPAFDNNRDRYTPARDVVFLLDATDATRSDFPAMQDFVQRVVEMLLVDEKKDRVSVVQYSRDPAVQFYLNTYMTKDEILNAVRNLRHKGGRSLNTGAALQYLRENVFTASSGSRRLEGVPQLLILLSSGRSADSVDAPASALKQMGILTFAVGSRGSDSRELQRISHNPNSVISVTEFTDLSSVLSSKIDILSSFLSLVDTAKKDVVFLLDGSDGTRNGFSAMRDFVERLVEKLSVGENKDRVSVVQYSREAEVHFSLNTHRTREDVMDAVRGLRHRGGRPLNTGAALQYVMDNVFTNSTGSRRLKGVPQILILLAGGRSFDNVDTPASALKQRGIFVFAIGSRTSDSRELQRLSFEPSYALSVSDFSGLDTVQEQISSLMSAAVVRSRPLTTTETARDVVFLLDATDATRSDFPAMQDFVQRVVEMLLVDEKKDRVSVVQYSRDPAVQFYLNTYMTKDEILNAVRKFEAQRGEISQHWIPQLLILLSSGRSADSVDAPASALKQMGILTFAVGSRGSDSRELQRISHNPNSVISVTEFTDLSSVPPQQLLIDILSSFLSLVDTAKKDVVFLLDGSDGTRNGFSAMRDFVERLVEKLSVGENKDRVSVVQYSREAEVHFSLNTHRTREDVMDAVRGLRHRGGRPLNTGAALQYVMDNVFTNSTGSRRLKGVPQILILLAGGRSFDNVDTPASALKQRGIFVFAIGSRTSDSRELQRLSFEPSYALSVSDFSGLDTVQEQISSLMSAAVTPARDVVFLLDATDATRSDFPAMQDFVQRVVEMLLVDEKKDRVSVVQYSRDPAVQFYLNTYMTKDEILNAVRNLRHKGGRSLNTGAALQYLMENVFTASSGSRRLEGVPQLLILLTGGRSFDNVDTPASALKQRGIFVFAIGSRTSDSRELQRLSFEPSYALSVSDFSGLDTVQEQISSLMSAAVVRSQPLTTTETARDVVFLLDATDATRSDFPAMQDFVQRVVEMLLVDEKKDRVSVVQYSRDPAVQFYLNTYMTKDEILNAVRNLRHKGGRSLNTGAALQYLRENVFTASSGSRRLEGVPQLLILLSSGRSADSVDAPASALKQMGILTFAVGSRGSDSRELQRISHNPNSVISVTEFTDLSSVPQQLLASVEALLIDVTPETPTDSAKKDVVFLLDGSDGTRNGFSAMRDFVERLVEKLSVGENKDRVSVVQYSREAEVHFSLNTHRTREDVMDAVRGLRHRGGRPLNTGAALQYVMDNVFTNSTGSRRLQGVPQILILLAGGRSFDNVDTPASALKQRGIFVFAIGSRTSDSRELQRLSFEPSYALSVSDFSGLDTVQEQISSLMSAATPARDVVFLLDATDATRSDFPAMQDFVQRVVEMLLVDEKKDRVSVVLYSRDPAVQFYLNTYMTKDEILNAVRNLRHKGGRSLNTGAALQYLRENVFTASSGSRRLEGVPQLLILLSSGRSADSVNAPASALKQMGILTFAVGSRGSDSRELQRISHNPNSVISVTEFTDLSSVPPQQLLASVEALLIDVTPETPTDSGTSIMQPFRCHSRTLFISFQQIFSLQISLAQYAADVTDAFFLNTYDNKENILTATEQVQYRGGPRINTGAAIRHIQNVHFTKERGSRMDQGVPQILMVVTGGASADDSRTASLALQRKGVRVFAVGAGDIQTELEGIASESTTVARSSNFQEIFDLVEQLLVTLSDEIKEQELCVSESLTPKCK